MTLEWIRFWITAVLLGLGLITYLGAVIGSYRFGFVFNCMHAAGIGDTLGILLIIAGLVVSCDSLMTGAKLILVIIFLWSTSPISTHFLGQAEYFTNDEIEEQFDRLGGNTHDTDRNH